MLERTFSPEEKAKIEKMGWDKLMESFASGFEEQDGAHHGGNKMDRHRRHIPFGARRPQPEGHPHRRRRKGRQVGRQGLGEARLQGLRRLASSSARATSRSRCGGCAASRAKAPSSSSTWTTRSSRPRKNAGWLDIKLVPERHNNVKVLMLMDVGGTMDEHIQRVEELF